jgi:hypothetical protein
LSADGRREFEKYRASGSHKAFAVSPEGAFAWRSGQPTVEAAMAGALAACTGHADDCRVMFADDVSLVTDALPQADLQIGAAARSVLTK